MSEENLYAPPQSNLETKHGSMGELELAKRSTRFGAAIIDGVISLAIMLPLLFLTGLWEVDAEGAMSPMSTIILGVLGFGLFLLLHGYLLANYGQTIGKRLLGIRIVSFKSDEILPLWKVIVFRYLPLNVVSNIPLIGPILILINCLLIFLKNKRCGHDLIAGTKVVKVQA